MIDSTDVSQHSCRKARKNRSLSALNHAEESSLIQLGDAREVMLRHVGLVQRARKIRSMKGQAAILLVLSLFTAFMFFILATDMGTITNDHIRRQNAADLTAYAGAFEQARTMNRIASINREIYELVQELRGILNNGESYQEANEPYSLSPIFWWTQPSCVGDVVSPDAEELIESYQKEIDDRIEAIRVINTRGRTSSQRAAENTMLANLPPWAAPVLSLFENIQESPGAKSEVTRLFQQEETLVGYNFHRRVPCCTNVCCTYQWTRARTINTWNYKDTDLVYFPVKIQSQPASGLLISTFFGHESEGDSADAANDSGILPSLSQSLYGYASAKPFGGILGTADPDNHTIGSSGPNPDSGFYPPGYPLYPPSEMFSKAFRGGYPARITGISEGMGSGRSTKSLIEQDLSVPTIQKHADDFTH